MANKLLIFVAAFAVSAVLVGCSEPVVKAGVPPPDQQQKDPNSNKPPDRQGARGGLGLPKELPKGPY